MPVITGQIDTYKIPTNARDLSQAFYMLKYPNTPIFNMISIPGVATAKKREWWDDVQLPSSTTLSAAYTAADGTMTLTSVDSVRVNSIIKVGSSIYRVTAVNTSTKVATIAIVSGDSNHADASTVEFLSTASLEGNTYTATDNATEVLRYNMTQIFDDWIDISGSEMAVNREINQGDLMAQKSMRKMERIYYAMAKTITSGGVRVAPSDNTTPRMMGGIDWHITTYGYNPSAAAFSAANLDAFLYEMEQTYSYTPTALYMNPYDLKRFAGLDSTLVRIASGADSRGEYVDRYRSGYGYEVDLIADPTFTTGKLRCFDMNKVSLLPLQGRQLQAYPLAVLGDLERWGIVGEYTLEFNSCANTGAFSIS